MAFRYLEHTADAKFEATANTLEELFRECARALSGIMSAETVTPKRKISIIVSATRPESLLFDFLSEIIFVCEDERFLVAEVRGLEIEGSKVRADLWGDDLTNYETRGHIKAITYHDMSIERTTAGWKAVVVVDL